MVQEISLQPEKEAPDECWVDGSALPVSGSADKELDVKAGSGSRAESANSGFSTDLIEKEEDGIEVIYDAEYQGKL